jgi:nitrate/nitrite transporter NarK
LAKISHKNKNAGYNPMCKLGELTGFAWKYGEFGGFFSPKIFFWRLQQPLSMTLSLTLSLSLCVSLCQFTEDFSSVFLAKMVKLLGWTQNCTVLSEEVFSGSG